MKKIFLAILIVFLALGVSAFIRLTPLDDEDAGDEGSGFGGLVVNGNLITLQALSKHKTQGDCWIAYGGKVYDLTSWLPKHPGSAEAIAPYCGTYKEFTDAFTKMHGTSKISMLMKMGVMMGDFEVEGNI